MMIGGIGAAADERKRGAMLDDRNGRFESRRIVLDAFSNQAAAGCIGAAGGQDEDSDAASSRDCPTQAMRVEEKATGRPA